MKRAWGALQDGSSSRARRAELWNWRRERAIESVTLTMSERGLPWPKTALTCHLCMVAVVDSKSGNNCSDAVVLVAHKAERRAANVRLSHLPDQECCVVLLTTLYL